MRHGSSGSAEEQLAKQGAILSGTRCELAHHSSSPLARVLRFDASSSDRGPTPGSLRNKPQDSPRPWSGGVVAGGGPRWGPPPPARWSGRGGSGPWWGPTSPGLRVRARWVGVPPFWRPHQGPSARGALRGASAAPAAAAVPSASSVSCTRGSRARGPQPPLGLPAILRPSSTAAAATSRGGRPRSVGLGADLA